MMTDGEATDALLRRWYSERYSEALHGGALIREKLRRAELGDSFEWRNVVYWAREMSSGRESRRAGRFTGNPFRHTTLPEAALEWPIYVAAYALALEIWRARELAATS